ncbi:MAG: glycoside hydrolase family 2, partial [Myxococcales bacterium]
MNGPSASGWPSIPSMNPPPSGPHGGHGYPRPQLQRATWQSLNGRWQFAIDPEAEWRRPEEVLHDQVIEVPYAPETQRSGVGDTSLFRACWYRTRVATPALGDGERLLLHFGAVDYEASVWVEGVLVGQHEGGYTPFTLDVTEQVRGRDAFTLDVRAFDDPADLAKPRGKQDWLREPHSIWYPRTTGIWQTVWIERVPRMSIQRLRWTPDVDRWEIGLEVRVSGAHNRPLRLAVRLRVGPMILADDVYSVVAGEVHRRIALSDPGIDDSRNLLLWCPERPTLITAELCLLDPQGQVLDTVRSYTALRSVGVQGDRFVLNGQPCPLRLVLDQGYWPETGMTAPSDEALRRDVELTRQMGFNGARKHQKIEDPRYLYWADRLGLMVWEEMPSAYRFTRRSIQRLTTQWTEAVLRDVSHPCIIAWVPFNESWGVPNLPANAPERHFVQAAYHLTKSLDPTRPVIGNDGWESVATDIMGIHDYDANPAQIAQRYATPAIIPQLLKRGRPGGRRLVLEGHPLADVPLVLSEFGGIALSRDPDHTWGYSTSLSPSELGRRYTALMQVVTSLEVLAG